MAERTARFSIEGESVNAVEAFRRLEREGLSLQRSFNSITAKNLGTDVATHAGRSGAAIGALQKQLFSLQRELSQPVEASRFKVITREIDAASNRLKFFRDQNVRVQSELASRGGAGAGRGGEFASGLGGGFGLPLGAGAVGAAVGIGAAAAFKASYDAGRELERSNRLIGASAKEAGIAYDVLTAKAAAFSRLTAVSRAEGTETFAQLTRLAQVAGKTDQLDKIAKGFADLGAARGIKGAELATLAQQILSGQDEGLNRLGLPDPSKLYAEYAKGIGRTAESLTQAEKATAALDAVMRKAAIFNGAAERQLQTGAGQIDAFTASIKNLAGEVGQAAIADLGGLLGALRNDGELKTYALAAASVAEYAGGIKGLSIVAKSYLGETNAEILKQEEYWRRVHAAALDVQRTFDGYKKASEENQAFLANDRKGVPVYRDPLGANVDLSKLSTEESAFRAKFLADREADLKAEEQKRKQQIEGFRTAGAAAKSFLSDISQRADRDNPFVALFQKSDTAVERARKSFGAFGDDFALQMARIEQESIKVELATARFQSLSSAMKLSQEARRLEASAGVG
ncbi:MAG: hypothetical protein H0W76_08395, partial [Pyrinomonadaceae bacterium]|nr:hypothetical protein [Pyrinomonadaceae bacterium]